MKRTFFARWALVILCVVFFMTPFALRGARMALQRMTNNVKDWLPADFPETADLEWFGRHFLGEQFVVVTWPGCTEDDPRYQQLVAKLQQEIMPGAIGGTHHLPDPETDPGQSRLKAFDELTPEERAALDRQRAREIGDTFGLMTAGDDYQDWGNRGEKWLRGDKDTWFFVTPDGELYRWHGKNNFVGYAKRTLQRALFGNRETEGELIATLGRPAGPERPNEFHQDPRKLTARLFKSITTGPGMMAVLAAKGGPLWPRGLEDEYASREARELALERLSGTLFGPDGKQTCIVLTLSEPGKRDLRRVIGRPLLGRSQGRLLEIAIDECGIPREDLKLGGPPVDNVAIDEEGQITLARLIGYSALIGIGLSLVCFRSLKITIMVFFVGGVSAISSLGIVWWAGGSVDAILMSMPSLVYVLGLSGAVHIVNYYREAVFDNGLEGAPETAVSHGWKPCTLAAFTTALGLLSLNTSNIVPIRKFGFYSAIGVMATLILMFTYLPSALQLWPPGYEKRKPGQTQRRSRFDVQELLLRFWEPIGRLVVRRYLWVSAGCAAVFVFFAFGLPSIKTDVQLIKLFDEDSKIIRDYAWLEDHLGKLVPMELVMRVRPELLRSSIAPQAAAETEPLTGDPVDERLQLDFLERLEAAARIQEVVEAEFGAHGQGIVGHGMSVPTFAPELPPPDSLNVSNPIRGVMNRQLERHRDEYLATDYLRIDRDEEHRGSELWRVSLRLGALLNVDYGQFVNELKRVVEPVLTAYSQRQQILTQVEQQRPEKGLVNAKVAFLGIPDPAEPGADAAADSGDAAADPAATAAADSHEIDQTKIFAGTLKDLMACAGVYTGRGCWHNPSDLEVEADFYTSDAWAQILATKFDCIVLVRDHPDYDVDFIRQHAKSFVDARDHAFDPYTTGELTAADRDELIHVVYTGVVPIVYKAQRTLLTSLIDSIGAAFFMIAAVMMVLLRHGPLSIWNLINVRAGLTSMIPNVFPVVLIFGAMGYLAISVDIGTMMTASVAMGVAVDDTIHFLTWFRDSIAAGRSRQEAILEAYRRCAPAMSQTTLIGGLGLAVFAFSTFTPTQCFGVMMLTLLAAALIGDLIFLPALLAGPLGKYFCPPVLAAAVATDADSRQPQATSEADQETGDTNFGAPHIAGATKTQRGEVSLRRDRRHKL
jgi:predicted RND superfamily exporter protein